MTVTSFATFVEQISPPWLRNTYGARFIGLCAGLFGDTIAAGAFQAMRSSHLNRALQPADSLGFMGAERSMPRYTSESDAQYRARLQDAFDIWGRAGNKAVIEGQLHAAGFVGAVIKERNDWPGRTPVGYWSIFWVVIPNGSHTIGAAKTWGGGAKWGDPDFQWGASDPNGEIQTIRGIVEKWRPAHVIAHQVIFQGAGSLWSEFKWGDGTTWGGGSFVVSLTTKTSF